MGMRVGFNLLQVLVVMGCAPLVAGVITRLKEIIQSKRGPSILQPYRDLWKLFHKDEVVSLESSWIFRFTPYMVFVTPILVTLLIPVLTDYPLFFAFMGDMLGGGFVLALGGFFATPPPSPSRLPAAAPPCGCPRRLRRPSRARPMPTAAPCPRRRGEWARASQRVSCHSTTQPVFPAA